MAAIAVIVWGGWNAGWEAGQPGSPAWAEDGARFERVAATARLRVCIWPDYFAVTYRNPRNDRLEGLDIDMALALAGDLTEERGGEGTIAVDFVDSSFARFMDDLEGDACDVAMFGIGVTAARQQRVDFTAPYLRSGLYAVTTRTNRNVESWDDIDRPGRVVAVLQGTVMEPIMRSRLLHAELMVVPPGGQRELEVRSGRADVFIGDYPYTRRMLSMHDWARIIAPPTPLGITPYAYAVRQGEPAWRARLDRFVAAVKRDGRLQAAAERHGLTAIVHLE